jgi:hypothetical protein
MMLSNTLIFGRVAVVTSFVHENFQLTDQWQWKGLVLVRGPLSLIFMTQQEIWRFERTHSPWHNYAKIDIPNLIEFAASSSFYSLGSPKIPYRVCLFEFIFSVYVNCLTRRVYLSFFTENNSTSNRNHTFLKNAKKAMAQENVSRSNFLQKIGKSLNEAQPAIK